MSSVRLRGSALIIENDAVLLIEYDDENGLHYNIPGGGVEAGESIKEAVIREAKEEADIVVEVGPLILVYEYAPHLADNEFGPLHQVNFIFHCYRSSKTVAQMPETPDPHQTAVKWVPLTKLLDVMLYPEISPKIIAYTTGKLTPPIFLEYSDLTHP